MYNADGSGRNCGNDVSCVAAFIYNHGIVRKPALKVEAEGC